MPDLLQHLTHPETTSLILIIEQMQMYAFHYYNITRTCFTQMYHKDCDVCNDWTPPK